MAGSDPAPKSRTSVYERVKRAFDIVGACLGLVFLSPIIVGIALAIKSDSPGAVFYCGKRVGKYGRQFEIYKFRTMRPDSEELGTTTAKDDPRITRLGGKLRRYKLDELPQLLNVLKGEMSFVGPRPEVKEHTDAYNKEEEGTLDIAPGITDFSSLQFYNLDELLGTANAHYMFVSELRDQKNVLRLKYVRERGLLTDTKILMRTVRMFIASLVRGLKDSGS